MLFTIQNRHITCEELKLIGDNADYTAQFTFDEEWTGKTKTARFVRGGYFVDVLLANDSCTIPVEILKQGFVQVGVFTDKITTTPGEFYVQESIKEKNGATPSPAPSVYEQILEELEKRLTYEPHQYSVDQRRQMRANIKAATGGQRRVTQDTSKIIDLTPYTSPTNHFVCPCDGYLRLRGATSGRANASVDNYTSLSALNDAYNMTFVSEGAWIYVAGNPQTAQFLPIELVEGQ